MPKTSEKNSAKPVADALAQLLADTYVLQLKTQNYHWNVTGPEFKSLHVLFEEQYDALALAVDEIAERIRALGYPVQATLAGFASAATIKESEKLPDANGMLSDLAKANRQASETAKKAISVAEETDDPVSADLATTRSAEHDKAAWMLQASMAA